ncbi:MAG: flippase-like domain-containing protein [Gemmatimonadota bacterium]|nr:flippase-like domain-containing protein [Gemmatimonadota bacterium]
MFSSPQGKKRARIIGGVLFTVLLAWSAVAIDWRIVWQQLWIMQVRWLPLAVFANVLMMTLFAGQWVMLKPADSTVPYKNWFAITAMTLMITNTVPYGAGQAYGVWLISKEKGIKKGTAISMMALEQITEGFAKLTVVGAVAAIMPLPDWLRGAMLALSGAVFGAFFILLSVAILFRGQSFTEPVDPSFGQRVKKFLIRWAHHLESLRDFKRFFVAGLFAISQKVFEASSIYIVQYAFGMEPTVASVLLVLVSVALAQTVPVTPGNVGVYEAAAYVAYRTLGISAEQAIGMALIHHLCILTATVGMGYIMFWRHGMRRPQEAFAQADQAMEESGEV